MDDAALVQRAAEGDAAAFAALFDRYGAAVHDHLLWTLQDRDEAAYLLYDAFSEAGNRIAELREPDRFRAWIFALAGRHALRRRSAAAAVLDAPPPEDTAWGELVQAVRGVAAELSPRDRALIDLKLRHGMEGEELARAVGAPAAEAREHLDRLVERVERSLSDTVVAHLGAQDCPELQDLVADDGRRFDKRRRESVAAHAELCAVCGPRHRRHIPASSLLAVMPVVPIPHGLRERLLEDVELAAHRALPWSGRRGGFPPPLLVDRDQRRRVVAAALALVLVGTAALLVTRGGEGDERVAAVGTTTIKAPTTTTTRARVSLTTVPTTTSSVPDDGGGSAGGATGGGGGGSSGSGTPAGGGSGGGGGGGGGGGTSPGTSTTTAPPTTQPPTTTTTTTTPPRDGTGPSLSGLSVTPSEVRGTGCGGSAPTTATVRVTATDPSGIASVTVIYAGGGAAGTRQLASSGGSAYSGTVGPFDPRRIPGNGASVQLKVIATDSAGNSSTDSIDLTLVCPD